MASEEARVPGDDRPQMTSTTVTSREPCRSRLQSATHHHLTSSTSSGRTRGHCSIGPLGSVSQSSSESWSTPPSGSSSSSGNVFGSSSSASSGYGDSGDVPPVVISNPLAKSRRKSRGLLYSTATDVDDIFPSDGARSMSEAARSLGHPSLAAAQVNMIPEEEEEKFGEIQMQSLSLQRNATFYTTTTDDDECTTREKTTMKPLCPKQYASAKFINIVKEEEMRQQKRKKKMGIFMNVKKMTLGFNPGKRSDGDAAPERQPVGAGEPFDGVVDDSLMEEVEKVHTNEGIPHDQALVLCRVKRLIKDQGTAEKAVFYLLEKCKDETLLDSFLEVLLSLISVDVTATNDKGQSFLHMATTNRLVSAADTLIRQKVPPCLLDNERRYALEYAISNNHDKLGAMIVAAMPKEVVRGLFTCPPDEDAFPRHNFYQLASKDNMLDTSNAIMDAMVEKVEGDHHYKFHFSVLEADISGRPPDHPNFSMKKGLLFSRIEDNKDLRAHSLMRVLIHEKWGRYGEKHALFALVIHMTYALLCAFAFISAGVQRVNGFSILNETRTYGDPTQYIGTLSYFRLVAEVILLIGATLSLISEAVELRQSGPREYFTEAYNYHQLFTNFALFILIPLRLEGYSIQWVFMAFVYMLIIFRVLKAISILRLTGIYLQILVTIMVRDILRFSIIYSIFLVAFSGGTYLILVGSENVSSKGPTGTDLDRTPELHNFPTIVLTLLRIMVQNENDGSYFGVGYHWMTVLLRIVYLFVIIIVLLNILIAQLSDTYAEIKQDAQLNLEHNWAGQLLELEKSFFWRKEQQINAYRQSTVIEHPEKLLLTWEEPADFTSKLKQDHQQRMVSQQLYKQEQQIFSIKASLAQISQRADDINNRHQLIVSHVDKLAKKVTEEQERVAKTTSSAVINQLRKDIAQQMKLNRDQIKTAISDMLKDVSHDAVEKIVSHLPDNFVPPV